MGFQQRQTRFVKCFSNYRYQSIHFQAYFVQITIYTGSLVEEMISQIISSGMRQRISNLLLKTTYMNLKRLRVSFRCVTMRAKHLFPVNGSLLCGTLLKMYHIEAATAPCEARWCY